MGDARVDRILQTKVPLIVRLSEKTMRVDEIMAFNSGTIIEFNKQSDELLDILVNNHRIGRGEVVKVGEKFGIQVKEIINTKDSIKAMGR